MLETYQGIGVQNMERGALIRETHLAPTRFGAITEDQAICFFDRSSMWSQFIDVKDVDDSLVRMYARPNFDHPSHDYRDDGLEVCREWVMVYRYYPKR